MLSAQNSYPRLRHLDILRFGPGQLRNDSSC